MLLERDRLSAIGIMETPRPRLSRRELGAHLFSAERVRLGRPMHNAVARGSFRSHLRSRLHAVYVFRSQQSSRLIKNKNRDGLAVVATEFVRNERGMSFGFLQA